MAEQMAAVIEGDFRNRLRRAPRGGSERFHAIDERGSFACGYDLPPGTEMPAKDVPADLRCRRAACLKRFAAADVAGGKPQ